MGANAVIRCPAPGTVRGWLPLVAGLMKGKTMTTTETLASLVARLGITLTAVPTDRNECMEGSANMAHWLVTLHRERHGAIALTFSMGAAHRQWNTAKLRHYHGTYTRAEIGKFSPGFGDRGLGGAPESIALRQLREECSDPTPPTVESVLDCLASDASSYDNARNFDEWAEEFGMDTDSRKAERSYKVVADQAKALRHFMGAEYNALLYQTERL